MNADFENNEFFRQLPEETKEKLRNCKSEEEAMEVLKGDMVPIPDEVLDGAAGGACYSNTENCTGYNPCFLESCSEYDSRCGFQPTPFD